MSLSTSQIPGKKIKTSTLAGVQMKLVLSFMGDFEGSGKVAADAVETAELE